MRNAQEEITHYTHVNPVNDYNVKYVHHHDSERCGPIGSSNRRK